MSINIKDVIPPEILAGKHGKKVNRILEYFDEHGIFTMEDVKTNLDIPDFEVQEGIGPKSIDLVMQICVISESLD